MTLAELLEAATPGPWLLGDVWSLCGVMPERFGEGKCVHCVNIGTEPVWVGHTDINGTQMLAHRHLILDPYDVEHHISGADGSLVCGNYDYESGGVLRGDDARLIALAPDLARLALDMGEALRVSTNDLEACVQDYPELAGAYVDGRLYENRALLARLDGIANKDKTT